MIEVPISISMIAWISVVVVQALIHFVVFGVRRERIQQEEEAALEETLSLTTSESFTENEFDQITETTASTRAVTSSSFGIHDIRFRSKEHSMSSTSPCRSSLTGTLDFQALIVEPSPHYLMQTGTELFKV
jgi:hypothetical protein